MEQATTDAAGSQGFAAGTSGTPRSRSWTYDSYAHVLTADGPRTDVGDITTYTYYDIADPDLGKRGNLATVTNALGHVTQFTAYDANGRPLTIIDPNGLATNLTYDARGRLTGKNVGGEITSYQYDSVGQLTQRTLPDGAWLADTYDAAHRMTGISDNLGNQIAYILDAMGNRTKEDIKDSTNQLSRTRSRAFDTLNRLYQDIGAQNQITQYGYDANGNLTTVTDPLNRTTVNAYDALNRLIRVTDPANGQTQYAYTGLDQITSVTDPRSLNTGYTRDGLDNLNRQVSPDTGTTVNTYDAAGNLLTQTDAKGQVTAYTYDALNRVTNITFNDGSKQTYAYDQGANGIGRLTAIIETNAQNQVTSQTAYAYDQKGRLLSDTRTLNSIAYLTGYTYDASGRLAGITYPSGRQVAYTFDALGRVTSVATTKDGDTKVLASNVAYQPFGGVKSFTYGNGQSYNRGYDLDGRIASYTLGATQFNLGFDAASRIAFIAENANPANINNYGYDALDRLTQSILPNASYGYGYDAAGNRLSKSTGAANDSYGYAAGSNRLAGIQPASGPPRTYQYDANGSTTGDGANQYAYDPRGRLVQAVSGAGASQYQVNALGQRVQKSAPGPSGLVTTVFHYDKDGRLIAESDAQGAVKREYLYLNDLPIAVLQ